MLRLKFLLFQRIPQHILQRNEHRVPAGLLMHIYRQRQPVPCIVDILLCRTAAGRGHFFCPQHLSGCEQFLKQSIDRNNAEPGKLCSLRLCKYTRLTHDISQECKILIAQIVLIHSSSFYKLTL